jgi:hypothetical protein
MRALAAAHVQFLMKKTEAGNGSLPPSMTADERNAHGEFVQTLGSTPYFERDQGSTRADNFLSGLAGRKNRAPTPWATTKGDLTFGRQWTKKAVIAAELAPDLSFTSFRHGGLTELGDSELTDSEIWALSGQQSSKVLPRYIKRTEKQIIKGTKKRRATRTKEGRLSE